MRSPTAVLLLGLVGLLGACGGEDDPPAAPETPSETASTPVDAGDPQSAAQAWVQGAGGNDGATVCSLQTDRYTEAELERSVGLGVVEDGASCEDVVAAGFRTGQAFGIDLTRATVTVLEESSSTATFRVELEGAESADYAMVLDDGRWLVDEKVAG